MKKYIVELTIEERSQLDGIIQADRMAVHKRLHAQMLLAVDQGSDGPAMRDTDVAKAFACTTKSVERLRRRFVEKGIEAGLEHGNRGRYRSRRLDGQSEAHLIALACGKAPQGRNRWCVRLLADQMVALGYVDQCSHMAVHRVLKKMNLSLT